MSQVAVHKCKDSETGLNALLENIESITDSIRQRAFDTFQHRAEREQVSAPPSELADDGKVFRARIAVPGFDAKDIQVSAMPDALVIQARSETLQDAVLRQLTWAPEIDVTSKDGAVTLAGCIHSCALKIAAEEAAKSVYGAKALANDIKLMASR